jgi:hypothetical protein
MQGVDGLVIYDDESTATVSWPSLSQWRPDIGHDR